VSEFHTHELGTLAAILTFPGTIKSHTTDLHAALSGRRNGGHPIRRLRRANSSDSHISSFKTVDRRNTGTVSSHALLFHTFRERRIVPVIIA